MTAYDRLFEKGSLANSTYNIIVICVVHRVECINLMCPVSIATLAGLFLKMYKSFSFCNILRKIPTTNRNKKNLLHNFLILI
jgi:hypothetical protein